MTAARRFGGRERVALYLVADGKCQLCGAVLEPGWHADHVRPFSRGGTTDVINGQALCPACNLRKGTKDMQLRPWQQTALDRMLRNTNDFLCVACPGAGKTTFALTAAQNVFERRDAQRLVIVVPSSHLRQQWAEAAIRVGIRLDHRFENGSGAIASDMHGVVITYQAVASNADLYRAFCAQRETLVVLDEVHHGGHTMAWGEALKRAFSNATRRLLLSGTPTRTDRKAVPFVFYNDAGQFIADYEYLYGSAIQDHVVRPIEFRALDGQMRWRVAGKVLDVTLADADDDTMTRALQSALHPGGDWIRSVLTQAHRELERQREAVPDTGGLVVAWGQYEAREYARILEGITGQAPTVAISEDPSASEQIKSFTDGRSPWLVAVQMVSEGVDIPRLAVGVYATRIRDSEMFFRQVVGRFVRMRGPEDETTATLFIPSVEPLLRYAAAIERAVDMALKQEEDTIRQSIEAQCDLEITSDFDPLHSSEAQHYATILSGDSFTDAELQRAETLARAAGLPASVTAAQIARVLRLNGGDDGEGTLVKVPAPRPVIAPADEKQQLRSLVQKKVGRLVRIRPERPHSYVHGDLNKMFGDRPEIASVSTLNGRLDALDKWIREARENGS